MNKALLKTAALIVIAVVVTATATSALFITLRPFEPPKPRSLVYVQGAPVLNVPTIPRGVARDLYASKYNLEIKDVMVSGSAQALATVISGVADIGEANLGEVASANEQGADLVVFGVLWNGTDYVIVAKEEIASIKDLEGKTIGIENIGGISYLDVLSALKAEGENPDKVNWAIIGFAGTRMQALAAGKIDVASIHFDQYLSLKEKGVKVKMLASASQYNSHNKANCMFTTRQTLEEKHDLLVDFMKSYIQANRKLSEDRSLFVDYMKKYKLETPDVDSLYGMMQRTMFYTNEGFTKEDFEYIIDQNYTNEVISKKCTFDEVATMEIVNQALAEIGRV